MPLRKNLKKTSPIFSRTARKKKKSSKITTFWPVFLVAIVLLAGYKMFDWDTKEEPKKEKNVIQKKLEEVISKPIVRESDPSILLADIEKNLANQVGDYGYSIVELDSGKSFGNREEEYFLAASTVKVGMAAYVYSGIESGKINPETLLTYTSGDYEAGTGSLQGSKVGSKFKVSFLLERMIVASDNIATNILIRSYGRTNMQNFLNQNGLSEIVLVKNQATPRVMTKLLAQIYNAKIIGNESKEELLGYMKKSIIQTRLVAGAPKGVAVAHKIGTQSQAISDIGIVYLKEKPFAISVYSRGITSVVDAEATIKNITSKVYAYENSR